MKKLLVALLVAGTPALAQQRDPGPDTRNEVVAAKIEGRTVAALVTHLATAKSYKRAIALFPGHPGIMRLREEGGVPRFEMGGNFLVRSRRWWLDDETLVAVIDAPSDQWASFSQQFRATPRYGADVKAILGELSARYNVSDWTLVGTSEGSISVYHAARMNPGLAKRVIFTSSLISANRNGPGLTDADPRTIRDSVLWVHHQDDPCGSTRYGDAVEYAKRFNAPLITVRGGGGGHGGLCEAFTHHGYVGQERSVVAAMKAWVVSGKAADVQ